MRISICILILFFIFTYWGVAEDLLKILFSGLAAIFFGMIIAYIGNIPLRFYERVLPGEQGDGTKNRLAAMALTIISIVLVLLFVGFFVIPQLVKCIVTLTEDAVAAIGVITSNDMLASVIPEPILNKIQNTNWDEVINSVASWLQTGIMASLPGITSFIGTIGAIGMGFVFAMWFLADKVRLGKQIHRLVKVYLGDSIDEKFTHFVALADDCFRRYFVAQSLEALILGSLVLIGMLIFGLPYAPMVAALIAVMALIPMVGALIGAILGAFMVLTVSWQKALLFMVVFVVVQQIEGNFIYSRVVGKRVGLTGLWPLIGVTLGAAFFGIIGAFAGVPATAMIFRIVEGDVDRREQLPENTPTPLDKLHESLKD